MRSITNRKACWAIFLTRPATPRAGPMLSDIADFLLRRAENGDSSSSSPAATATPPSPASSPAVSLLVGHDATLLSLLAAFSGCAWDGPGGPAPSGWPPTGANLRFELWRRQQQPLEGGAASSEARRPSSSGSGSARRRAVGSGAAGDGAGGVAGGAGAGSQRSSSWFVRLVYLGRPLYLALLAADGGNSRAEEPCSGHGEGSGGRPTGVLSLAGGGASSSALCFVPLADFLRWLSGGSGAFAEGTFAARL